jgi:ABC-type molybdate transport system ATPase subunit
VVLALGPQDRITATITPEAAHDMGLCLGDDLFALVKAPGVSVSRHAPAEQPGLNVLGGRLAALRATQRHVGCSVVRPSGLRIQAVMTDEWAAECHPEQAVWAVFPSDSVVLVSFQ